MDAERYIERAKEYVTKEDDGQSFSVYLLGHHIGTNHYPFGQQTLYIDTVRKFASALAAESEAVKKGDEGHPYCDIESLGSPCGESATRCLCEIHVASIVAEAEHWAWEAAIEIVLEEVSIAHPKEKEILACMSRFRARAAASREERG